MPQRAGPAPSAAQGGEDAPQQQRMGATVGQRAAGGMMARGSYARRGLQGEEFENVGLDFGASSEDSGHDSPQWRPRRGGARAPQRAAGGLRSCRIG